MYAIIEDSGTQIKVQEGDVIDIDLRELDDDARALKFDRVLMVEAGGEGAPRIGTPYVSGASVTADIVERIRGPKVDVIKFRKRTGYTRKQGHRQPYLRVKITGITA